jgi:hypothetical protein
MIAKLRLSPREMIKGRFVRKSFTIQQMKDIRSDLEIATQETFDSFDSAKRKTYTEIKEA